MSPLSSSIATKSAPAFTAESLAKIRASLMPAQSPLGIGSSGLSRVRASRSFRNGRTRYVGITGYPLPAPAHVAERAHVDALMSYCRYTYGINPSIVTRAPRSWCSARRGSEPSSGDRLNSSGGSRAALPRVLPSTCRRTPGTAVQVRRSPAM